MGKTGSAARKVQQRYQLVQYRTPTQQEALRVLPATKDLTGLSGWDYAFLRKCRSLARNPSWTPSRKQAEMIVRLDRTARSLRVRVLS